MELYTDDQIIFAAIAQGQLADILQSGVLRWKLEQPYQCLVDAAQVIRMKGSELSILNLSSICKIDDWTVVRQIWRESITNPKIDWKPAAERIISRSMIAQGKAVAENLIRELKNAKIPRKAILNATTELGGLLDNGQIYNPTPSHHYAEGIMGEVGISTGLQQIDSMLGGGLWTQALIGVGLPSNHGKSTLAYTLLSNCVSQSNRACLFTFETNTATAVARVLSALTGLPLSVTLSRKTETKEEADSVAYGLELLDKYFSIYDYTFNDPSKMEEVIRLEKPTLAVIDHLGMIDPKTAMANANRNDQAGDIADAALQWTIRYGLTIIMNAQFSNSISTQLKKNHDLVNTEFFGSSRIYNALDFAIIGLRHWLWPNTAYFKLKKNRKLGILDIEATLKHNPYTQSYEDM